MKKRFLLFLLLIPLLLGGCIKRDTMENINIYTTNYAVQYITNYLYGEHSTVTSIYPTDVIINDYKLTKTQLAEYSKADLFIFNGLGKEKDYILKMLDNNKNLKIIDSTSSMEYTYNEAELWLDPSNFLMLAQNIKNGLYEYINNQYLKTSIEENYEKLKINLSNLDAKIYLMVGNSDHKNIVVGSDELKFLSKYGLTVNSIDNKNGDVPSKTLATVNDLMNSGEIKYIILNEYDEETDVIKDLKEKYNVQILYFNSLSNITEDDIKNKKDYMSLINENIEVLREELFNE